MDRAEGGEQTIAMDVCGQLGPIRPVVLDGAVRAKTRQRRRARRQATVGWQRAYRNKVSCRVTAARVSAVERRLRAFRRAELPATPDRGDRGNAGTQAKEEPHLFSIDVGRWSTTAANDGRERRPEALPLDVFARGAAGLDTAAHVDETDLEEAAREREGHTSVGSALRFLCRRPRSRSWTNMGLDARAHERFALEEYAGGELRVRREQ